MSIEPMERIKRLHRMNQIHRKKINKFINEINTEELKQEFKDDIDKLNVHVNNIILRLILRVTNSTGYSMQGLKAAWKTEEAFRIESILIVFLTLIIFALPVDKYEAIMMFSSTLLVLIVELLNSAIEAIVDRIGEEHHELSGQAKDLGSAAVFVALLLAGIIWGVIILGLLIDFVNYLIY